MIMPLPIYDHMSSEVYEPLMLYFYLFWHYQPAPFEDAQHLEMSAKYMSLHHQFFYNCLLSIYKWHLLLVHLQSF